MACDPPEAVGNADGRARPQSDAGDASGAGEESDPPAGVRFHYFY